MNRRIATRLALACALATPPVTARATLVQAFQQSGQLDLEVVGDSNSPQQGIGSNIAGTLALSNVNGPVVRATLYFANFNNNGDPHNVTFNAMALGQVGPFASDLTVAASMYAYQVDVTALVTGAGNFSYSISEVNPSQFGIPGVALAVVYQDLSAPQSTVTIIEGMQQVGETGPETEQANFTGIPAGPTDLSIFTVLDNNTASGETVSYNGNSIAGPIDQNLGLNASLLAATSTSIGNNNDQLSVTTGADHMGWVLATSVVTVPEPSAFLFVGFLLAVLLAARCSIHRRALNLTRC